MPAESNIVDWSWIQHSKESLLLSIGEPPDIKKGEKRSVIVSRIICWRYWPLTISVYPRDGYLEAVLKESASLNGFTDATELVRKFSCTGQACPCGGISVLQQTSSGLSVAPPTGIRLFGTSITAHNSARIHHKLMARFRESHRAPCRPCLG